MTSPDTRPLWKQYRRTQIAEMADWTPDFDMTRVSVSAPDTEAGSPKDGDKIARNPANHDDQWLVAAAYFAANFDPVAPSQTVEEALRTVMEWAHNARPTCRLCGWTVGHNPDAPCEDALTVLDRAVAMTQPDTRCGGKPGKPGVMPKGGDEGTTRWYCGGCVDCRPPEQPAPVKCETCGEAHAENARAHSFKAQPEQPAPVPDSLQWLHYKSREAYWEQSEVDSEYASFDAGYVRGYLEANRAVEPVAPSQSVEALRYDLISDYAPDGGYTNFTKRVDALIEAVRGDEAEQYRLNRGDWQRIIEQSNANAMTALARAEAAEAEVAVVRSERGPRCENCDDRGYTTGPGLEGKPCRVCSMGTLEARAQVAEAEVARLRAFVQVCKRLQETHAFYSNTKDARLARVEWGEALAALTTPTSRGR